MYSWKFFFETDRLWIFYVASSDVKLVVLLSQPGVGIMYGCVILSWLSDFFTQERKKRYLFPYSWMQASLFQCCSLLSDWLKEANVISRNFYSNMCASVHPRMCVCVKERQTARDTDWLTLNWSQAGSCVIESPVLLLELGSLAPSAQFFYSIKTCISFETRQNQKNRAFMSQFSGSMRVSSQQASVLLVSNMITKFMLQMGGFRV